MNYVGMTAISGMTGLSGDGIGSLNLGVTDNGDGSVTLFWSGFNLTAIDPDGTWTVRISEDGVTYSDFDPAIPDGTLTKTYDGDDGLLLGTPYWWQVLAKDSGTTTIKVSNIVHLTLPNPWELSSSKLWRDFESDVVTTVSGRRILRSDNQFHSAANSTDFNFGTAFSVEMWVNKAATLAGNDECFFCKGSITDANGWGVYTGDHLTYGGDSVRMWTKTGGSLVSAAGTQTAANQFLSRFILTYNAGTVAIYHNGTSQSVTGSVAASLTNNSTILRIGRDPGAVTTYSYKNLDAAYSCFRLWNRVLTSDEAQALTANRDTYIPYASLESASVGITTGLVRNWEGGSTTDNVVADTLSSNGTGTIDLEERIVSHTDRVNEQTITSAYGRAPLLASGTVGSGNSARYDTIDNTGGQVGYSRQGMRASLDNDIHDTANTTTINIYRFTGSLHGNEHWFNTIDRGTGTAEYSIMGGYTLKGGQMRPYWRWKAIGPGVNGGWYASDSIVALDTTYTDIFTVNSSGTATVSVNGVAKTPVADFGGSTPGTSGMVQDYFGMGLNAGSAPRGNLVLCAVYNAVLTAAQQAQILAWINAQWGI
jgi:hypothetical protein